MPPTTPAIEAFALMREKRVSGVGVLDDREGLIANLSASDLRCIQPEHFGILGLPAAEFLALLHGTSHAGFSRSRSAGADNPFFAKMNEGGFRRAGPFLVIAAPDDPLEGFKSHRRTRRASRSRSEERDAKPLDVATLTDDSPRVRRGRARRQRGVNARASHRTTLMAKTHRRCATILSVYSRSALAPGTSHHESLSRFER